MRIWSIHPEYLDTKGILALWRETLLAKKVLENQTKGYKNHPQLIRFKKSDSPLICINYYLKIVWQEAKRRNYNFNGSKFEDVKNPPKITVNSDQIEYEKNHLLKKLKIRDTNKYEYLIKSENCKVHPLFEVKEGGIEDWEITSYKE
ncbi:MAG: hypothetical protein CSB55_01085 [Candidatus Cloacimonadota bacterium]|nr:MAG: hypothetical protein CSB55_01085 [Candidatus Cloacimonadota bacterium]